MPTNSTPTATRIATACALTGLVFLTSCSSAATAEDHDDDHQETEAITDEKPTGVTVDPKAPDFIQRVNLGGMSAAEIETSMQTAIYECMAEQGYTFTSAGEVRPDSDDGFGLPLPAPNTTTGYNITAATIETLGPPFGADYAETLPESEAQQFMLALFGTPVDDQPVSDGCLHESEKAVFKNTAVYNSYVSNVTDEMQDRIRGDERLADAQSAWSSCMAERGAGEYDQRDSLVNSLFDQLADASGDPDATSAVAAKEQQLAGFDIECAASTGYDDVVNQVYTDHASAAAEQLGYVTSA